MKDLNNVFLKVRKSNKDYRINLLKLHYTEISKNKIVLCFDNRTLTLSVYNNESNRGLYGDVSGDEFDRLRKFFADLGFDPKQKIL